MKLFQVYIFDSIPYWGGWNPIYQLKAKNDRDAERKAKKRWEGERVRVEEIQPKELKYE